MEEELNQMRIEVRFILFCSTLGRFVQGYAQGIVTFNAFDPKEFDSLETAIEAHRECRKVFRENHSKAYRLSIRRREYSWTPGGNTQLKETIIKLH